MKRCGWPAADARAEQLQQAGVKPPGPKRAVPPVRERYWPETLMVTGIIVGLVAVIILGSLTFIGYDALLRWFLLFAFAGNLLPWRLGGGRLGMERLEWFLFNLLAVGPILLSAALLLNFSVHGPERFMLVPGPLAHSVPRYWVEHDELPPHRVLEARPTSTAEAQRAGAATGDHLLGMADGCLGYAVVTEWRNAYDTD